MSDRDVDEQLVDLGLAEHFGTDVAPDLRRAVAQRLAERPSPRRRWLAAALVAVGTGVVAAAGWLARHPQAQAVAPAEPLPSPVAITSAAEAMALPATTRAVAAIGVDDAAIAALRHLRDLEWLIVREPCNETYGLGLKLQAPAVPRHVTNACWQHFGAFTKLRRLELRGTVQVARLAAGDAERVVAALEPLPLLETLVMACLDTPDEVVQRLPRLPQLRQLDLSFNHGITEAGVQALARCGELRVLSLRGCQQLRDGWLAELAALSHLEDLDVSLLDGINWRSGTAEPVDAEGAAILARARGWADSLQTGVQSQALRAFANLPALQRLDLRGMRPITAVDGTPLAAAPGLRELSLSGIGDAAASWLPPTLTRLAVTSDRVGDAFCRAVADLAPRLQHVELAACDGIRDAGIEALLALPDLTSLDLRQMRGLSPRLLEALAAKPQLQSLDLRHLGWLTAADEARLREALPRLRELQTSAAGR